MAPGCVEHGHLSNSPMRLPRRVGEQNLQPAEPLTVGAQGNHASPTRAIPASVSIRPGVPRRGIGSDEVAIVSAPGKTE
jgi:hypothetical protein